MLSHCIRRKRYYAKASTGSGKTAAYCIPIVNNLLTDDSSQGIKSIILVPTRVVNQVFQFVEKLLTFSTNKINVLNLSSSYSDQVLNSLLVNKPEIIISTPAKLIQILEKMKRILT